MNSELWDEIEPASTRCTDATNSDAAKELIRINRNDDERSTEAHRMLGGVSRKTLSRLEERGQLAVVRLSPRLLRYWLTDIEALISGSCHNIKTIGPRKEGTNE